MCICVCVCVCAYDHPEFCVCMYRHLVCHIRRHESVAPHGEGGLIIIIIIIIEIKKSEIGNIAITYWCVNECHIVVNEANAADYKDVK